MFEIPRRVEISFELFSLSEEERSISFCSPFRLKLLAFTPLDPGNKIVPEKKKMIDLPVYYFFFNLGEQEVNVLPQNSEQSACDN